MNHKKPPHHSSHSSRPPHSPHASQRPDRPRPSVGPGSAPNRARGDGRNVEFIGRDVRLIFEDDDVLVVDKPVGLVTADPSRAAAAAAGARPSAREGKTLFDFVKKHVRSDIGVRKSRRRTDEEGRRGQPGRVWVIHRLDKEASGLLVFAKSERAYESLKEQFRTKAAHRIYVALAEGEIGPVGFAATRESMIDEDRGPVPPVRTGHRKGSPPPERDEGKKQAITHYQVIGAANNLTLLRVKLETGRKNQIRIHMQEIGHPLVGDRRFGAQTDTIERLGLHAAELGFTHPGTGKSVEFSSTVPPRFFRAVGMKGETLGSIGAAGAEKGSVPARTSAPAAETSWDEVAGWYDTLLEDRGSDHYEKVILPGVIEMLGARTGTKVLDVACGQGILARRLAGMGAKVTGVDAAPRLIEAARTRSPEIEFHVGDARELGGLKLSGFDAAACVMALSNIDPLEPALRGIAAALRPGGVFVAVITHPAFRSPGESHWGWDEKTKRQYRRVDAYLTPFRKDMKMHPGKAAAGKSGGELVTPTFHRPLGEYVRALSRAGLLVTDLREWVSERAASSGPRAPEENRARLEIPLFLGIRTVLAPLSR